MLLAACGTQRPQEPELSPDQARTRILRLMPTTISDRQAWATDIQAAFTAQKIP